MNFRQTPTLKSLDEIELDTESIFNCIVTFSGIMRNKDSAKPFCKITGIKQYNFGEGSGNNAVGKDALPLLPLIIYTDKSLDISTELLLKGRKISGNGMGPEFEYSKMCVLGQMFDPKKKSVSDINPLLKYPSQTGTV